MQHRDMRILIRLFGPILVVLGIVVYTVYETHPEYLVGTGIAAILVLIAALGYRKYQTYRLDRMLWIEDTQRPPGDEPGHGDDENMPP